MTDEAMTDETKLPPCDRFTVLDMRKDRRPQCDVCDQLEEDHQNPGRRTMSGAEIEALRRSMIVEIYEKLEAEHQNNGSDGRSDDREPS